MPTLTSPPTPATAPAPPTSTWYFLTLIVQGRERLFGQVQQGKLALTPMGLEIARMWKYCAALRREIHLGPWMVMPDHFHALVRVTTRTTLEILPRPTRLFAKPRIQGPLGSLVAAFKVGTTREVNRLRHTPRQRLWRKGVLYRAIDGEASLEQTARMILENPREWIAAHRDETGEVC